MSTRKKKATDKEKDWQGLETQGQLEKCNFILL